ncbi:hypothetical protein EHQ46_13610 [Leptospira yanagawae]|uniref:Uncharacterized protein n=1 Tax=Leptospira yanagawae TaxID=293069 RepID=A0ABY2LYQ1_9LEPT|nr:hypothetical protein EHQ46_13610 [Leptospira yanagawae]
MAQRYVRVKTYLETEIHQVKERVVRGRLTQRKVLDSMFSCKPIQGIGFVENQKIFSPTIIFQIKEYQSARDRGFDFR